MLTHNSIFTILFFSLLYISLIKIYNYKAENTIIIQRFTHIQILQFLTASLPLSCSYHRFSTTLSELVYINSLDFHTYFLDFQNNVIFLSHLLQLSLTLVMGLIYYQL